MVEIGLGLVIALHALSIFFDWPDIGLVTIGVIVGIAFFGAVEYETAIAIIGATIALSWTIIVLFLVQE